MRYKSASKNQDGHILGHVYVVETPIGIKIGKSIDPGRRLRDLTRYYSIDLPNHWVSKSHARYSDTELLCHSILKDRRVRGEAFDISFSDAVKMVESNLCEGDKPKGAGNHDALRKVMEEIARHQRDPYEKFNILRLYLIAYGQPDLIHESLSSVEIGVDVVTQHIGATSPHQAKEEVVHALVTGAIMSLLKNHEDLPFKFSELSLTLEGYRSSYESIMKHLELPEE